MTATQIGQFEVAHRPGRVYLTNTAPAADPGMGTLVAWRLGVALCIAACDAADPEEVTHARRGLGPLTATAGSATGSLPATKEEP